MSDVFIIGVPVNNCRILVGIYIYITEIYYTCIRVATGIERVVFFFFFGLLHKMHHGGVHMPSLSYNARTRYIDRVQVTRIPLSYLT
jgi:hypothetical protein